MSYPPVPLPNGKALNPLLHPYLIRTRPKLHSHSAQNYLPRNRLRDQVRPQQTHSIVFITCASKGVGRATAISFAKAGAEGIAVGARSDLSTLETEIQEAAKAAGKTSPKVLLIKLDLLNHQSVKDAVQEVEKTFGRLDI
ncbi:hypothetical protein ACHAP3_001657 [Botrytis cinerea]